jgi:Secretion system C-terminal sorting domain
MKKLYILFFLTIGFLGNAQIVNIPDANFKEKLLGASISNYVASTQIPNSFGWVDGHNSIDINSNGEIEQNEAALITYLNISNSNINNLTGIEYFTNLRYLDCSVNNLTSLDVTGLNNLVMFTCQSNQLINLNITGLNNLKVLHCTTNELTTLNLLGLNNLETFFCSENQLITLDLTTLNKLNFLRCEVNQLETLFVKNNNEILLNLNFSYNYNLQYICADESDLEFIQQMIIDYGYANCHINSYCSFTPNGVFYEISGATKLDSNNNSCDVSDINYSNLNFSITDGTNTGSLIANQTGNYYIPVSAGNHTITPSLENPSFFNVSPTNFIVNFPTQTSPFTQDFCVTANGVKHDVEVVLIPTVPARPGFDATYKLVYHNKGNQVENGSISLTFDDTRLDYVVANPVYNSSALNNFTWNYTNLQPFESREITLTLNVNSPMEVPAVNNGDQLDFLAQITPFTNDEMQYDNISALKQIVVGSYDPNDKTCIQGETIEPSQVGNYVHYIIRFENTGTFPAENIVVKDMIDLAKFDIATLVPLKSSHDFFTRINGNKVEFIFENINLDFNDATNDGYVVFKIKTLPTLVLGDTFTNNANIYFDYNFPITTNTYTTTVAALSTQDFDFGTYFTLYPNPAKDVLNIQTKQSLAINSVEIYNQLGQIVMATTNAINSVDVANLASGTYFVKVNTEKGSANEKFVKE